MSNSPSVGKRVAVSAIAGVAIAYGGITAVSWISASTTTEKPFSLPVKGDEVRIDVGSGDVTVRAGNVDEVQVTRTIHSGLSEPDLTNTSNAQGIVLDSDCGWNWMGPCSVDYELVVPSDLALNIEASSGDIDVRNLTGDVTVDSSSGDIAASGLTGRTELSTSSGDLNLENISGPLTTSLDSGDLNATGVTSKTVTADLSSGDVDVAFTAVPDKVVASASSGDVTVRLPDDDTAYRVETDVSSGDENVDVPTNNNSSNLLQLETSSGDITVEHNAS